MASNNGLRRRVPAGLADAALASLATFATGLVGVNALDDVTRGVYAVFFTAFLAATVIPTQLVLIPAETNAVELAGDQRLAVIRSSLRAGSVVGLTSAIPIGVSLLVTAGNADTSQLFAFGLTAGAASLVSPLQDHLRRMLHLAGRSWQAASMSGLQLAGVGVSLGALALLGIPAEWLPFGALALANLFSSAGGLWMVRSGGAGRDDLPVLFRELVAAGRWLLLMALAPRISFFLASVFITVLADAEALGFAEAARLAAQPLYVLGLGLEAVVRPHAMVAASDRDRLAARQHRRVYYPLVGGFAVLYGLIAGFDWVGNPIAYLVPAAYEVRFLVVVTVAATLFRVAILPNIAEMLGARVERRLALVAVSVTPLQVLGGLTAGFTGAFARPVGTLLDYGGRFIAYEQFRDDIYGPEKGPPTSN